MGNKLEGKLHDFWKTVQITDTFKKKEFVIQTDEQYPQKVKFELTQDKCDLLDGFSIGQDVTVHFNVRGRCWTNKEGKDTYFVSLNAWRIEAEEAENETQPVSTDPDLPPVDDNLDLPF